MHHLPRPKEKVQTDVDREKRQKNRRAPHDLYLEVQTSYMEDGVT